MRFGRIQENRHLRAQSEGGPHGVQAGGALALSQLIRFREDEDGTASQGLNPFEPSTHPADPHARFDQQDDGPERFSPFKILLYHRSPLGPHSF